jgi:hypothetical protein
LDAADDVILHLLTMTNAPKLKVAAWVFAALFVSHAVLLFRVGVVQRRLSFAPRGKAWAPLARGLIVSSLRFEHLPAGRVVRG